MKLFIFILTFLCISLTFQFKVNSNSNINLGLEISPVKRKNRNSDQNQQDPNQSSDQSQSNPNDKNSADLNLNKSKHKSIGESLVTRIRIYEGSISFILEDLKYLEKGTWLKLKNDEIVKFLTPILSECKISKEKLIELKKAFDKNFKSGFEFMGKEENGKFSYGGNFNYESKMLGDGSCAQDGPETDKENDNSKKKAKNKK